ncbi:DUF4232 domain-containing protein [Amycolatopsis japonica]|uniref:DUF4232 domain-containing protein n=1 Tax=Amycolatopsis japonica TaxID=208439 RepID=UPI00331D44E5
MRPGCLDTGVTVKSGPVEAALGHRAVVLTLTNCGTTPRTLTGYPGIRLLDKEKRPMNVAVEHGTSYLAIDPGSFVTRPHGSATVPPQTTASTTKRPYDR